MEQSSPFGCVRDTQMQGPVAYVLATYKLEECTQSVYSLADGNPLYLYITFARNETNGVPYGVTCVLKVPCRDGCALHISISAFELATQTCIILRSVCGTCTVADMLAIGLPVYR